MFSTDLIGQTVTLKLSGQKAIIRAVIERKLFPTLVLVVANEYGELRRVGLEEVQLA